MCGDNVMLGDNGIFLFNHSFLGHTVLPLNHSSAQKCFEFFIPSSFDLLKIHLHGFLFVIQCLEKLMNAICRNCIYCSYV